MENMQKNSSKMLTECSTPRATSFDRVNPMAIKNSPPSPKSLWREDHSLKPSSNHSLIASIHSSTRLSSETLPVNSPISNFLLSNFLLKLSNVSRNNSNSSNIHNSLSSSTSRTFGKISNFQQDFQITRFPEGTFASEQQLSLVPQQQPQPSSSQFQQVQKFQSNCFNSGFQSPNVRPFTTVPDVTSLTGFGQVKPLTACFSFNLPKDWMIRLVKKVQTVPSSLQDLTWNKQLFLIPPTFSLRPDVVTAHSVVPASVSGIINRNPVSSTEGESTGTALGEEQE